MPRRGTVGHTEVPEATAVVHRHWGDVHAYLAETA